MQANYSYKKKKSTYFKRQMYQESEKHADFRINLNNSRENSVSLHGRKATYVALNMLRTNWVEWIQERFGVGNESL